MNVPHTHDYHLVLNILCVT